MGYSGIYLAKVDYSALSYTDIDDRGNFPYTYITKGAGAKSYMTRIFFPVMMKNSPAFSLNMTKMLVFPMYDENYCVIYNAQGDLSFLKYAQMDNNDLFYRL